MKNILEFIEQHQSETKIAVSDENHEMSYKELIHKARSIGSALLDFKERKKPIAVMLPKSALSVAAFLGVVYSGNFYVVIDDQMPVERILKIFETLDPLCVITSKDYEEKGKQLGKSLLFVEDLLNRDIDEQGLQKIRDLSIDTDALYALFTSGSTGTPKGALLTHRNVIAYISWVINTFSIDEQSVFGSQTPFYFSMSVTDLFSTLFSGATLHILPKTLFTFPVKLVEYMNEKKVNTIYWVPSALGLFSNMKVLDYVSLTDLKKILFAGEAMPTKYLNYWMDKMPDVFFANLYGPTETTDICTYYVVDRRFSNDESLPIGRHCDNCDVFILDEHDHLVDQIDMVGELCVRGSFLAAGYYNNPEKTKEAFMLNPINTHYPEIIYRTGDLVKYNDRGELIYITRKDFQIKHMGYRIELGEIETAAYGVEAIKSCVVIYDENEDKIVLIYQGKVKDEEIYDGMKAKVPHYMLPNVMVKVRNMPINQNGKIDRKYLKANYKEMLL